MKPLLPGCCAPLLLAALVPVPASAAETPPPVTEKSPLRVRVDQLGYRPAARKIVIVASDQPLPQDPTPHDVSVRLAGCR
jgi:hypothetical protein